MNEALFHVVRDERIAATYPKSWWAEMLDMEGQSSVYRGIGYGSTPGEAVDDLLSKLDCKTFVVPS